MSFVGTRPEATKYVEKYSNEMLATLLLPAGITSEASIRYKDEAELLDLADDVDRAYIEKVLPEKMKYNLQSIKNFCFVIDVHVMIKTLLESVFAAPEQTIFLDANFFIPPDRSVMGTKPIPFLKFCEIWLDPIFDVFPNLAIHESVYRELVTDMVRDYVDSRQKEKPPRLRVYTDAELSEVEMALMQAYISMFITSEIWRWHVW